MNNLANGLTLRKFFSPFYSTARRRFRLSARHVDDLISIRAKAELHGHDLVFVNPSRGDLTLSYHRFRMRPRMAADWVNLFNLKSDRLDADTRPYLPGDFSDDFPEARRLPRYLRLD